MCRFYRRRKIDEKECETALTVDTWWITNLEMVARKETTSSSSKKIAAVVFRPHLQLN
jgi:hypothetical protein